jgi:hypothetical protein
MASTSPYVPVPEPSSKQHPIIYATAVKVDDMYGAKNTHPQYHAPIPNVYPGASAPTQEHQFQNYYGGATPVPASLPSGQYVYQPNNNYTAGGHAPYYPMPVTSHYAHQSHVVMAQQQQQHHPIMPTAPPPQPIIVQGTEVFTHMPQSPVSVPVPVPAPSAQQQQQTYVHPSQSNVYCAQAPKSNAIVQSTRSSSNAMHGNTYPRNPKQRQSSTADDCCNGCEVLSICTCLPTLCCLLPVSIDFFSQN